MSNDRIALFLYHAYLNASLYGRLCDFIDIFPASSENAVRIEFWGDTIDSIKYFDVEMSDILLKLKGAIIPFNKSFHEVAESKPDLYGPFWIYTTIIFLITVAGNISGYLHTQQGEQFHYNYSFIPYAALFIYGFGFGAPLILFLVMKIVFKIQILLMVNICVYGYSFIVLIPVLFLCMIPSNFVETILLLYFIIHSGIFLFYNMWVIIQDKADKAKYVVLGILGGIHVILFFGLKCYFFAEANVQTKK